MNQNMEQRAYCAMGAASGKELEGTFHVAGRREVDLALTEANSAYDQLRALPSDRRAEFLVSVASKLRQAGEAILVRCEAETALPLQSRLQGELERTCQVLEIFAGKVRSGELQDCRITAPLPNRQPRPRPDIRRMRIGIGPVVVIEASNFPLAFGVVGGDTASAWAGGCPVVAKAHPYHPGTSELAAAAVREAIKECGMPEGVFSLVHGGAETVKMLVLHPFTRGVAFTGSRRVGQSMRQVAASRERPLDELSLEMGSLNPMWICEDALRTRPRELAAGVFEAVTIGCGQYCTKPGNIFVPVSEGWEEFRSELAGRFIAAPLMTLLARPIADAYASASEQILSVDGARCIAAGGGADQPFGGAVKPLLYEVDFDHFRSAEILREEVFGPCVLLVKTDPNCFEEAVTLYQGELTGSLHGTQADWPRMPFLIQDLQRRVGRIVFNGYPPGVELCEAMNHSGPWPAALGRFTVVGPSAYERWQRLVTYQNAPMELLPPELQEANPLGLQRRREE